MFVFFDVVSTLCCAQANERVYGVYVVRLPAHYLLWKLVCSGGDSSTTTILLPSSLCQGGCVSCATRNGKDTFGSVVLWTLASAACTKTIK